MGPPVRRASAHIDMSNQPRIPACQPPFLAAYSHASRTLSCPSLMCPFHLLPVPPLATDPTMSARWTLVYD